MTAKQIKTVTLNKIVSDPFAALRQIITLLLVKDFSKIDTVTESIKQSLQTSVARILLSYYVITGQKVFRVLYNAIINGFVDLTPQILKFGLLYTDISKLIDPEPLFSGYQENILYRKVEESIDEFNRNNVYNLIQSKLPFVDPIDAWQIFLQYGYDFVQYLTKANSPTANTVLELTWQSQMTL